MPARRLLNLIYGMCADRMTAEQLTELDDVLTLDMDNLRERRNAEAFATILAAGGEIG